MKINICFVFSLLSFVSFTSCNTTEPPPPDGEKPTLELKLEDVSCTEAWITLKTTNLQLPATITLKQYNPNNDSTSQTYVLNTQDTLLYIDSLLPNQTYKILAAMQQPVPMGYNNASNELCVTTLDTTSHNFTFETFTFGGTAGSSSLYDVAIINENNIWAVGEIMITDTSENGYTMYNATHWNGGQWELLRIPYIFQGDSFYNPIYAIFAFNADDIWFGIGNLIHWNGTKYIPIDISTVFPSLVNKIWGSSNSNLYVVGNNGSIVFYNGSQWRRIESGTDLPIRDIWGDFNIRTSTYEILAVAAEVAINNGSKVLRIDGSSVTEEINNGLSWDVGGIWFKSGSKYYIAGAGIHYKHFLSDSIWNRYLPGVVTNYVGYGTRGSDINDVFAAGSFLEIAHFNGLSWHNYLDEISSTSGAFGRIVVKGNMMVAVGSESGRALIVIGKRN
ncbi:MAG: glucosyl transferase [Ignavibacteriaceae bacterium]|jgi:hypothetical protein|nr:glucosyl transferase [Ignavibacteriaceae bacterium]